MCPAKPPAWQNQYENMWKLEQERMYYERQLKEDRVKTQPIHSQDATVYFDNVKMPEAVIFEESLFVRAESIILPEFVLVKERFEIESKKITPPKFITGNLLFMNTPNWTKYYNSICIHQEIPETAGSQFIGKPIKDLIDCPFINACLWRNWVIVKIKVLRGKTEITLDDQGFCRYIQEDMYLARSMLPSYSKKPRRRFHGMFIHEFINAIERTLHHEGYYKTLPRLMQKGDKPLPPISISREQYKRWNALTDAIRIAERL